MFCVCGSCGMETRFASSIGRCGARHVRNVEQATVQQTSIRCLFTALRASVGCGSNLRQNLLDFVRWGIAGIHFTTWNTDINILRKLFACLAHVHRTLYMWATNERMPFRLSAHDITLIRLFTRATSKTYVSRPQPLLLLRIDITFY